MATSVKLKVRKLTPTSPDQEAQAVLEAVQVVMQAIHEGEFDAHLDVLFKAIDDRIRDYQEEDGDGELPTRDRADKLRTIQVERVPVIPVEGRHYRLRGSKYQGVVVMFLETAPQNDKGTAMVKAEAIGGNGVVKAGKVYILPVTALEEIPDIRSKPLPKAVDAPLCRKCKQPVNYSGRGRPKNFCDKCLNIKN